MAIRPIKFFIAALFALAFLAQNQIAEQHFHPLVSDKSTAIAANKFSDAKKPSLPTPGQQQQGDDCPLCQVLGLGTTTDLPTSIVLQAPSRPDPVRIIFAIHESRSVEFLKTGHSPRGPPALLSA